MKIMYVQIDLNGSLVTAQRRRIGRDDRIGTRDIFYPKKKALPSCATSLSIGLQCHCRESLPCFPHRQCTSIDIQFLLPFLLFCLY